MTELRAKETFELKAEPLTSGELDSWLAGKRDRRILVLPYGGPLPRKGAPLGVDLDGEWFDENTDIFCGIPDLKATRSRLVDFHHDLDPTGVMKGAILGHVEVDEEAQTVAIDGHDYTGRWGSFWTNAGEARRALVARLEREGVQWYGSSKAAFKKVGKDGHLDQWAMTLHTITTSPQNTYAVVPSLKATLDGSNLAELPVGALKAYMVGLDDLTADLGATLRGEQPAKSGRVLSRQTLAELRAAIEALSALMERGIPVPLEEPTSE